jgi:hypothetical protein
MPSGPTSFPLAPNTWTQVEWIVGIPFFTAAWTALGGATVQWRWFTSVPPFTWTGSLTGRGCITYGPGLYTSLQMNPGPTPATVVRSLC